MNIKVTVGKNFKLFATWQEARKFVFLHMVAMNSRDTRAAVITEKGESYQETWNFEKAIRYIKADGSHKCFSVQF